MMMKHIGIAAAAAVLLSFSSFQGRAQDQKVDSVALRQAAMMDPALVGKSIFTILPSSGKDGAASVTVNQSQSLIKAFNSRVAANGSRKLYGYRVRIFSDNKQNARGASEAALARFKGMYPGLSAYRTYTNPFFKVTVGDFRTKSEAMKLLQQLKGSFPTAFIVSETINYPPVERGVSYVSDNVANK
jgi:Sporulation related domain.